MKKLFVLTLLLSGVFLEVIGQGLPQTLTPQATNANFALYEKVDGATWQDDFHSYQYSNLWFRLLEPLNYDVEREESYPLFIFFHGAGEGSTDNIKQLKNGGQFHRNAVRQSPVKFEGLLLYPQAPNLQNWKFSGYLERVRNVVMQLVNHYNVDPTRIYINGLSMGGGGAWEFFLRNPEMVATAYPTCDISTDYVDGTATGRNVFGNNSAIKNNSVSTTFTPLWYSHGGLDGVPSAKPPDARYVVNTIRENGGEIRYLYFPNMGHNVWDATWAQSDYFTNMLSKSKLYIVPLGGQTSFCPGTEINVTLGITAGYAGYQWQRSTDNLNWSSIGGNSHTLQVTQTGYYRVRFSWGGYWGVGSPYQGQYTEYSVPILIDDEKPLTPPTLISSNGRSVNLPSLDGATSVDLIAQPGFENYQWTRNATVIPNSSSNLLGNVSQAGTYAASVWQNGISDFFIHENVNWNYGLEDGLEPGFQDEPVPVEYRAEPAGCQSEPSNSITVTTSNGPGVPVAPDNFFVTAISANQIKIDWDDRSDNELGFEIYRATQSGGPYQIIAITEPKNQASNPQSYIDGGRLANTTYYYRMRAVNENGGSSYTQEKSTTTSSDDQSPTPPTLEVKGTTRSTVKLQWFGSVDNTEVVTYEIYRNGQLTNSISAPTIITNQTKPLYITNTGNCTWVEYQAEEGTRHRATVESNHNGYTGSGFVDTENVVGSYLEIDVNAPAPGTYNMRMRFANGGGSSGSVSVDVNGSQQIEALALPSTLAWTSWAYADFSLTLSAGNNKIKFTSLESAGAPNIDRIDACTSNLTPDEEFPVYEYTVTGLAPLTNYSFYVRGIDANGNASQPSNLVTAATINQGLDYKFYTHSGLGTVDNITASGTFRYEGNVDNFDISVRNVDDYFAFVFEGQIVIPNTGNYTFYTSSDDGSKLYINDVLRVNNDGDHGCIEAASSSFQLTAGSHSIKVLMYENAGGQCLEVRWEGPGIEKNVIPDAAFRDNFTVPTPPIAPSGLFATAMSHSQINLTWTDDSYNETGFEIYRRTGTEGVFAIINTVNADATEFSDNNLLPSTPYFYQIRAISSNGGSTFSNSASATTQPAPVAPDIPGDLTASVINNTVLLSWTDNSDNEVGFEIYRTTSSDFTNWTLIATTTEDIEEFVDNAIYVNSTYYYKIRAKGAVLFSDFTSEVTAETATGTNNPPVITPLPNTTMVINQVLTLLVEVSDPDGDAVSIDFELIPARTFAELNDDGDGIVFSPQSTDHGVYTVRIIANDGNGGTPERTFTLTVLENAPVFPPAAPSGLTATALSPTSIDLSWVDSDDNEVGFRIYRATDFSGPYIEHGDVGQNETSFEDNVGLTGNTTYYYRIVSYNSVNDIGESAIINVTTLNSPPIIETINSIYVNAGGSVPVNVTATDPEGHAITFVPFNFPAFMNFTDNGDGTGTITIAPQSRHVGTYGRIRLIASDALNEESSEDIFVVVGNPQFEELIYVNFDSESGAGAPWNNTGGTNDIANLVNANGTPSGISFSHSGSIAASDEGYSHPSNAGLYDNSVIRSKWTAQGESQLTFNNLDPDLIYNIQVLGSDHSITSTDYTVGSTTKTLSTLNNSSGLVYFNVSGQPSVTINLAQGVVNAIVLQAYNAEILPAPTSLTAKSLSYSSIELRWQGNAGNAIGYEIYRRELPSGNLIPHATVAGSTVETFVDTGLPANASFEYAVRAINNSLTSAFTSTVKGSTFEHVVKINFNTDSEGLDGYDNSNPANLASWGYWNNINYAPPTYPDTPIEDARNENGQSTSIGLSIVFLNSAFTNNFGVQTGNNSGLYPDQVMKTFHFVEGYGLGVEEWTLTNLQPGKHYNLTFFTSVIGTVLDDLQMSKAVTKFEVNGISKELEPRDNTLEVVAFEKVTPNENGEIPFKFSPANNTIRFGVLNAMVVEVYKNPDAIVPTKTYYAQNSSPIDVPASWKTEQGGGGQELTNLQEDGNELIIAENSTLTLDGNANFGGIGTKLKVTGDATISIDPAVENVFINALEIDEEVVLTFNGTGKKNIRIGDGGLTIANEGSIILGNNSLTLNGNATINKNGESGRLVMDNGSLTFNSTSQDDSHLYFDENDNNVLDLTINNTGFGNVQLMNKTQLRNVLKLNAGNLDTKNGNLVLVHNASGVALIDKVEVGASLTGQVEYQRYWERGSEHRFGYYHIGVPVKNQRLIDWSGDFFIQGTDFYKLNNFANVQLFNESQNKYIGLKKGNDLLEVGKGYTAFIYPTELADDNVFYNNTGSANIGNGKDGIMASNEKFEFPLSFTPSIPEPGWNFLSNPYPCVIDFDNFDWNTDAENIIQSIYIYDSEIYQFVPWNYEMVSSSLKIYPGQGFFVRAIAENPVFRITEDAKTTDLEGARIFRKGAIKNVLTIQLNSLSGFVDKTYFGYKEDATEGLDVKYDAPKIFGKSISITTVINDSVEYSINAIGENTKLKSIPLHIEVSEKAQHTLTINGVGNFDLNKVFYLHDKYDGKTLLLPKESFEYSFNVNEDLSSYYDRFELLTVPRPEVMISSNTGYSGEQTFVAVNSNNFEGISKIELQISWDPNKLQFDKIDSVHQDLSGFTLDTINSGLIIFKHYSTSSSLHDIDKLFTITFTPKVDNQEISISILDESSNLFIEEGIPIPVSISNGKIQIFDKILAKGSVFYKGNQILNKYSSRLMPDQQVSYSSNGEYSFLLKEKESYTITIEDFEYNNFDIDIYDLIALRYYLHGRNTIANPIDLISADVDENGRIEYNDFLMLTQNIFRYRKNGSTRIGKNLIIANKFLTSGNLPTAQPTAVINDTHSLNINFNTSFLGDIVTSLKTDRKRTSSPDTTYLLLNEINSGLEYHYHLAVESSSGLTGYQMNLSWNNELIKFKSLENKIEDLLYEIDEKNAIIKMMWVSQNDYLDISNKISLLNLKFEKLKNFENEFPVSLHLENPTLFLNANLSENIVVVKNNFSDKASNLTMLNTYPNPFSKSTNFGFSLKEAQEIEIVVYNSLGELIAHTRKYYEKGYNEWMWEPELNVTEGIYLYRIKGMYTTTSGKIVFKK